MHRFICDLKKFWKENKFILFASILITVLFSFANMFADDVTGMRVEGGTLSTYWAKSVEMYYTWASRVLVNFIVFIFTDNNPLWWAISNGISMYVLLFSFKELFIENDKNKENELFMICMVLMFPYGILSSAGWIATITTLLPPFAFGMLSLVPIKRVLENKKLKWWNIILYALCLIYGANEEQVMVVLLASYLISLLWYLFIYKRINLTLAFFSLLSIASAVFILRCPGNWARKINETATWFPGYEHLNLVDKLELGYDTVAYWLVFGNNLFFIISTLILCYLVVVKYEDHSIRIISAIPAFITIGLGPLQSILVNIYPSIAGISAEIPYWGLVNAENRGGLGPFTEFFTMSICIIIVLLNIFLICNTWNQFLIALTLFVAGFASSVVLGFSPTIYASGTRTNTVMSFCIIASVSYLYCIAGNSETKKSPYERKINIIYLMEIATAFSILNLVYKIYNTW